VAAAVTFVVGLIFLPEPKDRDMTPMGPDGGRPQPASRHSTFERPRPWCGAFFMGHKLRPAALQPGLWQAGDADSCQFEPG
jgi:hypothetical protein